MVHKEGSSVLIQARYYTKFLESLPWAVPPGLWSVRPRFSFKHCQKTKSCHDGFSSSSLGRMELVIMKILRFHDSNSLCVCIHVNIYMHAWVCMHTYLHMCWDQRSMPSVCLCYSLSYCLKTGSHWICSTLYIIVWRQGPTESGTHRLAWLVGQWALRLCPSVSISPLHQCRLEMGMVIYTRLLMLVPEIQTQILMLVKQAPYSLSHLPRPWSHDI